MSIIKYEPVHIGDFSSFIENLVSKTKSKRFRAGFMKKADDFKKSGKYIYRTGKFDFKYRKTWKQTDGTMYKRKGKARTTKSEDYLLAHDLVKKAPRNISYQRLLWISVGKKIWGVSQFRLADEHIRLYVLNPTKYSQLKNLLIGNLDGEYNAMTMITFENDQQRKNFRMRMALTCLEAEANSKLGIRMYRGSIVQVLREYFPDLPRTRKSAYKYLIKKGYYNGERN